MDAALGPPAKMRERREDLTPMMAQYFDLCEQFDDALVLFQVGDFYEAFCEAAETVARQCEITLTKREDSTGTYAMAGIPIDNAESYIERLLAAGYRVAVADQVEEPEETTGVVDRAVTRVITPGTLTEDELLSSERSNYVAALAAGEQLSLAVLDVSTGAFYATSTADERTLADELSRFDPAEAVVGPDAPASALPDGCVQSPLKGDAFQLERARETLGAYVGDPDSLVASDSEIRACGAVLSYAEYTRGGEMTYQDGDAGAIADETDDERQSARLSYINQLVRYDPQEYMLLDAVALDSLELFDRRAVHGRAGATLVEVVDETACALGRRRLDEWLRRPLLDKGEIRARHDAVGELKGDILTRESLADSLRDVYDIERLISRIVRGRANARDLRSLKDTLDIVPQLREDLADSECEKLTTLRDQLDPLSDVRELIGEAIREDPARELTEGGLIKPTYDDELASLRETEREGKAWVDDLEATERERTGIDSLKVGHNSVHGYYIEVTDANLDRVPEKYERRQTLKNSERYYTPELKSREDEIFRAENRADDREYRLFCEVRSQVGAESQRIQALSDALAELDVLVSFATVAAEYDYTRPTVEETSRSIRIEDGRHPVVERTQSSFVPNDTILTPEEYVAVITGPNMSGKSTYMRQVALISVLAQAGSFVPAREATLPLLDRIFTRVGASDDIAGGRSTFMVEMTELATILEHATERSLVLLDEVGRGTSTADGFAIAQAVTEFLHDETGALTLFATHHHDLTAVAKGLDGAYNLSFRTHRDEDGVQFEHLAERGAADASYGVEVAATAGIDDVVVSRARELLDADRAQESGKSPEETISRSERVANGHVTADTGSLEAIARTLATADVATMTPLEAMNVLAALKAKLEEPEDSELDAK